MNKNRSVSEWLELWGDFEKYGSLTGHLRAKSAMQSLLVVVVQEFDADAPQPPAMSAEEEKWLLDKMAIVKRKQITFYLDLYLRHADKYCESDRRFAAYRKISERKAIVRLAEARGYCEALFEI